jgi:hypothetical protein
MTKVAKKTVSNTAKLITVFFGLAAILFQKNSFLKESDSTFAQMFTPQIAHADFYSGGGSLPSCQEGTCEGCSGCGDSACGADNGGCSGCGCGY